jgi:polysaccharide export outer membrane protein
MNNALIVPVASRLRPGETFGPRLSLVARGASASLGLVLMTFLAGCQTDSPQVASGAAAISTENSQKPNALTLREGDVVKISFPGTPNLDTSQTIRRDGKLDLAMVGETQAAGLTPTELQAQLLKLYAPQLVSKEVSVTVVSSPFAAFVTGAVLRPGKISTDHVVTVLEAIMEAGGFDYARANLKAVSIIRQNADGKTQNFTVNLKLVLDGKQNEPFFLKPSDIVYVPERFSMY